MEIPCYFIAIFLGSFKCTVYERRDLPVFGPTLILLILFEGTFALSLPVCKLPEAVSCWLSKAACQFL